MWWAVVTWAHNKCPQPIATAHDNCCCHFKSKLEESFLSAEIDIFSYNTFSFYVCPYLLWLPFYVSVHHHIYLYASLFLSLQDYATLFSLRKVPFALSLTLLSSLISHLSFQLTPKKRPFIFRICNKMSTFSIVNRIIICMHIYCYSLLLSFGSDDEL